MTDFLAYARPRPLRTEPVAAGALLEGVREVLAGQLAARRIEVVIDDESDGATVLADPEQMRQLLMNLVQNAVEAPTRAGETPEIRIDVTGDRYGVQIAVSDRGTGVPDEARSRLFHPFFTTKVHGTGLGLASSRAIAEAHSGSIGFENLAGGGA